MRHRFFLVSLLIAACLSLTACGYHIASQKDRPTNLVSLSIDTPNNDSYLSVLLERELSALGVNIKASNGPQLVVKSMTFTHPQPTLFNSGTSYTVQHTLTARWQLLDSKGNPLSKVIITTQSLPIIHNANQFDTPSMQALTYRHLSERLAQLMIYRIFATFSAKQSALGASHATQS